MQKSYDYIDQFDADKRNDQAAKTVNEKVVPEHNTGLERAVGHTTQRQRYQRNDDQCVEYYR